MLGAASVLAARASPTTSRRTTASRETIASPDFFAVFVAFCAGIGGMLSLTTAKSGALIGVLISVTTIPAAANVGVSAAVRRLGGAGAARSRSSGVNLVSILARRAC